LFPVKEIIFYALEQGYFLLQGTTPYFYPPLTMILSTAYFNSPTGLLSIETDGTYINTVHFVHSLKDPPMDEKQPEITVPAEPLLQQCIAQLQEYFEGSRKVFDLPLRQQGTAFQLTVWKALTHIPYGRTISYMELAKRINNVKAIRAVGTSNGSNNIAIIVPCHRVIGSDGSLTGYGGGLWRKQWLLEHENKFANGVQVLF
jgi:methylated-DNA-[protein]-cysteine S-methyltransferase